MSKHFNQSIGVCAAVLFGIVLASAARAQACPPLVKIASVKLERLPNARRVAVPVTINGVPKKFLLDTAGLMGFITKEAAEEIKLPRLSFSSLLRPVKSFGLGGQTWELAETENNDTTLLSTLKPTSNADKDGEIDGSLVNPFLLNKGDLDLDFPGGTLSLFSPDHCPGNVNHWGAKDIGYLPLSTDMIPPTRDIRDPGLVGARLKMKQDIGHMTVPVSLDGHKLNAWINTAAEKSSISWEVAERIFGLTRSTLGPETEVKLYPEQALGMLHGTTGKISPLKKVYRHKFANLAIGHIDIKNLELQVFSDRDGRNNDDTRVINYSPDLYLKTVWNGYIEKLNRQVMFRRSVEYTTIYEDVPDMVLGMDVLRHLHVYLSLKEKRMYFSAGAASAPSKPAPAEEVTAAR